GSFLNYYQNLLDDSVERSEKVNAHIVLAGYVLTEDHAYSMIRPFSEEDVRHALLSIDGRKSPGPDWFNSSFFKVAWEWICDDISEVVLQFFENGKILNKMNATNIVMAPNVPQPKSVTF
ncbi:LINE-1 reverse transcriptase-like protein, partial [Bienertia sinuspersici]